MIRDRAFVLYTTDDWFSRESDCVQGVYTDPDILRKALSKMMDEEQIQYLLDHHQVETREYNYRLEEWTLNDDLFLQ